MKFKILISLVIILISSLNAQYTIVDQHVETKLYIYELCGTQAGDFSHYRIHYGYNCYWAPSETIILNKFVDTPTDSMKFVLKSYDTLLWKNGGWQIFIAVSGVDNAGNESALTDTVCVGEYYFMADVYRESNDFSRISSRDGVEMNYFINANLGRTFKILRFKDSIQDSCILTE